MVTDGPFLESKEYLAGFWVIEAPDLDVALKLAAAASKACCTTTLHVSLSAPSTTTGSG